jgi:oxygen-dependent protoporphyrinogen oxidase
MAKVIIVGAGISGLALAYRLQQLVPVSEITILERGHRPGGTIWTERRDGFQIEIGPNGFLDNKPSTLQLCRDLGLSDQLVAASEASARNRYLFLGADLQRLPTGLVSFLMSDLLSWRGKLNVLAERLRPRRSEASDESVAAFVRRRAGAEAAETFADALVTGIFAGDPSRLSVRAAFPLLAELEAQHGSVMKGLTQTARRRRAEAAVRGESPRGRSRMWSFAAGLRELVETLSSHLTRPPLLRKTIRLVEQAKEAAERPSWMVTGEGQERWSADVVALTCPASQQAQLLSHLDGELCECIADIPYNRLAVVSLGYRQADVSMDLNGFGFIAPQRSRRDLLGVQWCSSIFPDRAPAGRVLLRAMCGGWNRPEMVDWDDTRLVMAVRTELRLAMGIEADPVFNHIVRWHQAIPQYVLGHLERVAWIDSRLARYPGLYLGGNAYRGVSLNDCTEQAETLARRMAHYLTRLP